MSNQVQSNLAAGILDQFHVNIGLNLQSKLQDWQNRQSIQYGAMKGLMKKDWHSLSDFYFQMSLYSSTDTILRNAWSVIQSLVPNNPRILATLVFLSSFGLVGQEILSLIGVSNIVVAPQDILLNKSQFNSTIASVS
jgi:hypothetical protein